MVTPPNPEAAIAPPALPPSDVERQAAWFAAWWSYPLLRSRALRTALLIALALLCLVRAYIGLTVVLYSHDGIALLDGAWRTLHGQAPHADFYSPLGPLIYLITAFGLLLSRGGAEGAAYSQALCGCLLGLWAYGLSRRRLGHLPAILLCLTVVLLAVNPSSVGEPPLNTSCMPYNRYSFALVALLLVEAVAAPDSARRSAEFRGGLSTGAALALLLFLKISCFVGGVALTAMLLPCRQQLRTRWAGIVGGFLPVFLAFCAYLRFDLVAMWSDFRMVAGAKPVRINWFIVDNLYLGVALYLAYILASTAFLSSAGARPAARAIRISGVAVCITGIFLLATNFQFYGLPLHAVMAILVLQSVAAQTAPGRTRALQQAVLLGWGGLLVAGALGYEAMGLGFGVWQKNTWQATSHTSFHAGVLAGFHSLEPGYVDMVNDGLHLVSRYRRPGDTVMSLDFSNPFSYALGMQPAPGGATTLHYPGNFTDAHHPSPQRLFGQATLVIVPVVPSNRGLERSVPRIYGSYLAAHFAPAGESAAWRLYRRD